MRCNTCGNEIADGSLSCPFCGAPFSTRQQYTNGQIPYMNGQYSNANDLNPYIQPGYNPYIPTGYNGPGGQGYGVLPSLRKKQARL